MKKYTRIALALMVSVFASAGCERLLDVDSDQVVFPDEHQLNSPNEIMYPMIGIFSRLEKISDRYVLLGELRGDLMDVTENAGTDLQEIYNFDVSADNPYNKIADYYSVINNCNYLICNVDTAIILGAEKVMYREYAAAKAIRAWTYMQIALNYGMATYYEEPILTVEDAKKTYPEYTMDELAPILIQELEPLKNIEHPQSISLGTDISSQNLYFPIRFLLGDLYLWTGEFEKAAQEYHDLMLVETYLITEDYQSYWDVINGVFVEPNMNWSMIFFLNSSDIEQITLIAGSTEFGQGSALDSISVYSYEIAPSSVSIDNWNNQTYYHNTTTINQGDMRGEYGSYFGTEILGEYGKAFESLAIVKYENMSTLTSKGIFIYRSGLLYLRYAEAVNRAGKPNLAFAVLKNGMNAKTLETDSIVPANEKYANIADSILYSYMNFSDVRFDDNIGVHARGCGNVHLAADYIIPPLSNLEDSVKYVEDKIVEELALETAFEGNRFHDLMRISFRRNDPAYLADKVAAKYPSGMQETIRTKLMDSNNWYLSEQ